MNPYALRSRSLSSDPGIHFRIIVHCPMSMSASRPLLAFDNARMLECSYARTYNAVAISLTWGKHLLQQVKWISGLVFFNEFLGVNEIFFP